MIRPCIDRSAGSPLGRQGNAKGPSREQKVPSTKLEKKGIEKKRTCVAGFSLNRLAAFKSAIILATEQHSLYGDVVFIVHTYALKIFCRLRGTKFTSQNSMQRRLYISTAPHINIIERRRSPSQKPL